MIIYYIHIIRYMLLYAYVILFYTLSHCQWITVEIHTVSSQGPKILSCSMGKTNSYSQRLSEYCYLYSILLKYKYNLKIKFSLCRKGLWAHCIIFVHWLLSFWEKYLDCSNLIRAKHKKESFDQNVLLYSRKKKAWFFLYVNRLKWKPSEQEFKQNKMFIIGNLNNSN